jgi:hypothetical protein
VPVNLTIIPPGQKCFFLLQCLQILTERYVIHMLMNRLCISDIPTNGILLNQMYINYSTAHGSAT